MTATPAQGKSCRSRRRNLYRKKHLTIQVENERAHAQWLEKRISILASSRKKIYKQQQKYKHIAKRRFLVPRRRMAKGDKLACGEAKTSAASAGGGATPARTGCARSPLGAPLTHDARPAAKAASQNSTAGRPRRDRRAERRCRRPRRGAMRRCPRRACERPARARCGLHSPSVCEYPASRSIP